MTRAKEPAKAATVTAEQLAKLELSELARIIRKDWPRPYFGAAPYIDALLSLSTIDDMYGYDSARDITNRFLINAAQWKGATARLVKAELKARLKRRAA